MASSVLLATEREARIFARFWRGNVFSVFVAPVLLLVAMGVGLGSLVNEDTASLDGQDYLTFITPGLLVASAVQAASGSSLWPVMAGHKWLGFHRAMVATPLTPTDVLAGHVCWLTLRSVLSASVFLVVAAALGGVPSLWGVLAVPVVGLATISFAAPIAAYSARAETDASFDPLIRMFITPLFLFSGTFFPISELPALVAWVARVLPLWHGVELARSAVTGSGTAARIVGHLAVVCGYIAVGWWFGVREFRRRLTP